MPITRSFRNRFSPNEPVQPNVQNTIALDTSAVSNSENPNAEKNIETLAPTKRNLLKKWFAGLFH